MIVKDPNAIEDAQLYTETRPQLRKRSFLSAAVFLIGVAALGATLKPITSFELPGPAGKRFDYLTIDYDDHYLLSAHLPRDFFM
jgi:hypothetical protein